MPWLSGGASQQGFGPAWAPACVVPFSGLWLGTSTCAAAPGTVARAGARVGVGAWLGGLLSVAHVACAVGRAGESLCVWGVSSTRVRLLRMMPAGRRLSLLVQAPCEAPGGRGWPARGAKRFRVPGPCSGIGSHFCAGLRAPPLGGRRRTAMVHVMSVPWWCAGGVSVPWRCWWSVSCCPLLRTVLSGALWWAGPQWCWSTRSPCCIPWQTFGAHGRTGAGALTSWRMLRLCCAGLSRPRRRLLPHCRTYPAVAGGSGGA